MRAVLGAKCYTEFSFFLLDYCISFQGMYSRYFKIASNMEMGSNGDNRCRSNFVERSDHFDR